MRWIGIDLGTSTLCFVRHDFSTGESETITLANDAGIAASGGCRDDEDIQDAGRIFDRVRETLDAMIDKTPDAAGIALTGQMHGIVYLDSSANALSPLYTWRDGRAHRRLENGLTAVETLEQLTGHRIAAGYGLATDFYLRHYRQTPPNAAYCATIADYTASRLAGLKKPITEASNAASLGLFDVSRGRFDASALQAAQMDPAFLPNVVRFGPIGTYRNIPVFTPVGDNQAAFAAAADEPARTIHLTVGTGAQMSVFSEQYIEIDRLETRPYPGGFLLVGASLCGGSAWRMLHDFFAKTLEFFGADTDTDLYAVMAQMSKSALAKSALSDLSPNKNAALFEPLNVSTAFAGTRSEPNRRGLIDRISTRNFTPENLAAGFLNGIAEELYGFYAALPDSLRAERPLLAGSGNGLRRNCALCEIIKRKFGRALILPPMEAETAFGAIRLAASASRSTTARFGQRRIEN